MTVKKKYFHAFTIAMLLTISVLTYPDYLPKWGLFYIIVPMQIISVFCSLYFLNQYQKEVTAEMEDDRKGEGGAE